MRKEKIKNIIIGGDAGGFELKNAVCAHLREKGYEVFNVNPDRPAVFSKKNLQ